MTAVKSAKKKAVTKAATKVVTRAHTKTSSKTATRPAAKKAVRKSAAPAPKKAAAKPVVKKTSAPRKAAAAKAPVKPGLGQLAALALDEMKGQHITVLDVRGVTDIADTIVVASGTSDRHVKSLATRVQERARAAGYRTLGVEGEREGEWVLVDLGDVIVHVMLPRVREFYALEKLWDVRSSERDSAS